MEGSNQSIIKKGWLMGVYYIVPVLFIVFLGDLFIFEGKLQPYLTSEASDLPLYMLIFEFPHIIASFFGFADRDYLKHYRSQLLYRLPVIIACVLIVFYFSFLAGMILYAFYTMYHVIRQQTGIALTMTHKKDWLHESWTYLGVVIVFIGFLLNLLSEMQLGNYENLLRSSLLLLATVFVAVSLRMVLRNRKKETLVYMASVAISIFVSYIFFVFDYMFLAIFALRFIHDVTAFIFYIAHDKARNSAGTPNYIYRIVKKTGLPIIIATPLLATVIAYILRSELMVLQFGLLVIISCNVAHYYLEGIMWKGGSPHRSQLKFE